MCACDVVLASESSRFVMAYSRIGLSADGGSSYFLTRAVGFRRALELALTNRMLSASEARNTMFASPEFPATKSSPSVMASATVPPVALR